MTSEQRRYPPVVELLSSDVTKFPGGRDEIINASSMTNTVTPDSREQTSIALLVLRMFLAVSAISLAIYSEWAANANVTPPGEGLTCAMIWQLLSKKRLSVAKRKSASSKPSLAPLATVQEEIPTRVSLLV